MSRNNVTVGLGPLATGCAASGRPPGGLDRIVPASLDIARLDPIHALRYE